VRDKGLLLPVAMLSLLALLMTTGCRSISPAADGYPGCGTTSDDTASGGGNGQDCAAAGTSHCDGCGAACVSACGTSCGAACGCGNGPQGLADRQSPIRTQCLRFGLLGPLFSNPRLSQGTACWPWQYMYNVTLAGSQFSNAVLGGDPDESLSSRLGRAERDGVWPVKYAVSPAADLLIGPSHCWGSIEEDESRRMELWPW
jgi:hypothetical protein